MRRSPRPRRASLAPAASPAPAARALPPSGAPAAWESRSTGPSGLLAQPLDQALHLRDQLRLGSSVLDHHGGRAGLLVRGELRGDPRPRLLLGHPVAPP